MKLKRKIKSFAKKTFPLWMALVLVIESSFAVGLIEYYFLRKNFERQILEIAKNTKDPSELVRKIKDEVIPQSGYKLSVRWGSVGQELLEAGVIDKDKYEELFKNDQGKDQMKYLVASSNNAMTINEKNSRFMVNTLWAVGLVNKLPLLENGPMQEYGKGDPMGFASTGGWDLGSRPTREIYSSRDIINLSPSEQELVKKIAGNVYRPCCNNPTSFPDCNHGMAALGYIEMAVKQSIPEERIYKDLLALNSYWFPQQYVELATYLNKQGKPWKNVDAKVALSAQYSSAQGSQQVGQSIQTVPDLNIKSGGCGA